MAQFSANPSQEHLEKVKYICCYLAGTRNYVLAFKGKTGNGLEGYADSDWAADQIKRWSITGYFFKLADSIFSWNSHAQKTVALSSTCYDFLLFTFTYTDSSFSYFMLVDAFPIVGNLAGI